MTKCCGVLNGHVQLCLAQGVEARFETDLIVWNVLDFRLQMADDVRLPTIILEPTLEAASDFAQLCESWHSPQDALASQHNIVAVRNRLGLKAPGRVDESSSLFEKRFEVGVDKRCRRAALRRNNVSGAFGALTLMYALVSPAPERVEIVVRRLLVLEGVPFGIRV